MKVMKHISLLLMFLMSLNVFASDLSLTNEKIVFEGNVKNFDYWCIVKAGQRGIYLSTGKWRILRIGSQNTIGYEIYQRQGGKFKFISSCVGVSDNM